MNRMGPDDFLVVFKVHYITPYFPETSITSQSHTSYILFVDFEVYATIYGVNTIYLRSIPHIYIYIQPCLFFPKTAVFFPKVQGLGSQRPGLPLPGQ